MNHPKQLCNGLIGLASLATPAVVAAVLIIATYGGIASRGRHYLLPLRVGTARQLVSILNGYDYNWPPRGNVPALGLTHFPDGLEALQPGIRKRTFLRALLPLVLAVNADVRRERTRIRRLLANAGQGQWPARLRKLATHYKVTDISDSRAAAKLLLRRCNVVPPGLVLAQAAKESGWGTSRFALQGNNLFGVHTWDLNAGLPASAAAPSSTNLVRAYADLEASIRDYIFNLNIGHAYVAFRKLRQREQANGKLNSIALAGTLRRYSQHGALYTHRIKALITQNRLYSLSGLRLAPAVEMNGD